MLSILLLQVVVLVDTLVEAVVVQEDTKLQHLLD
jgi:hypothetical protein